ncbi:uncharacterized protein LOC124453671 [Xenia sp. Carnegie-2017]|uniref:uncharacterized protein LOC124453671 n=1 Tax=Xenia sp. Carnegie-2017 TaxID=2897299 RepID=UPI001F047DE4|nr:uncharacterized protein LOC124453671 [Xenia sp. Carnegie-2017]
MENFNSFLLRISKKIRKADLDSMKFICKDYNLGERRLGEITEAYQLFDELQKRDLFSKKDLKILIELLEKVDRNDLAKEVINLRESNGAIPNDVIHNIAENISTDWKHLGRRLELSPGLLDGIDHDFRQVKEKTLQMLSRWKERKGDDATGQILADALVNIHRRDVAEDLQEICGRLYGIIIYINGQPPCQPDSSNLTRPSAARTNQHSGLNTMRADLMNRLPTQESTS